MRIVGGELGGRRLAVPAGAATRPTSDRVREAVASVLASRGALVDARVLDLFAGSGALGFEALSRGAHSLLSVEAERRALRCIEENARSLGLAEQSHVLKLDLLAEPDAVAARLAARDATPRDLIFADPPYADGAAIPGLLAALARAGLVAPDAWVVIEHARGSPSECPGGFEQVASYRYGDTGVQLWQRIA